MEIDLIFFFIESSFSRFPFSPNISLGISSGSILNLG